MKNKTYHVVGFSTERFDNRRLIGTVDENFMNLLRSAKRLSDDKVEEVAAKLKGVEYDTFDAVQLSDGMITRKGVTKILSEESIIMISKDLTKAKVALADYYLNTECVY